MPEGCTVASDGLGDARNGLVVLARNAGATHLVVLDDDVLATRDNVEALRVATYEFFGRPFAPNFTLWPEHPPLLLRKPQNARQNGISTEPHCGLQLANLVLVLEHRLCHSMFLLLSSWIC